MRRAAASILTRAGFGLVAAMTLALPAAAHEIEEVHGHGHVTWTAPEGVLSVLSAQRADPNKVYEITILFFYTAQFADDFRDRAHMEDEIARSVELLNTSMTNSSVNATFRTVGIERHPAMPNRQTRAYQWIADDPRAARRRDELGADLVYALVDDPDGYLGIGCQPSAFTPSTGESCFWGSVNNWTPYVRAFDNENIWQTVLRHEVGHNLGIQHSPEFGGDPRGGFQPGSVGYTVTSGDPWFGTVMGGNELPRFSTSSERFDFREHRNLVVGRPGVHEASTALLYSIGPVSNYRTGDSESPPCHATGAGINLDGYQLFMCTVVNGEVQQLTPHRLSSRSMLFGRLADPKAVVKLVRSCQWGAVAAVVTARKFQIRVYNTANGKEWVYNHNRSGLAPSAYSASALCD